MAAGFAQWGNDLYTGRRSYDIVGRRKIWFTISTDPRDPLGDLPDQARASTPASSSAAARSSSCPGVSDTDQQLAIDTVHRDRAGGAAAGHDGRRRLAAHPDLDARPTTQVERGQGRARRGVRRAGGRTSPARSSGRPGARTSRRRPSPASSCSCCFVTIVMTIYFRNWRMAARGPDRAVPRPDHHGRRVRGHRLGGHTGDGDRLPDDPRVLDLRHRRRLRQGAGEHRGHAATSRGTRTPRRPTSRSTRRWCARSTPRSSRCCPSARSCSSVRSSSVPARCATSRSRCSSAC